jgi:uncharacterized membrane protein
VLALIGLDIRSELIHPFLSHFPVALLLLVMVLTPLLMLFKDSEYKRNMAMFNRFMLIIGVVSFLPVIITGQIAGDIVGEHICDLMVIYYHKQWAYYTAIVFVLVFALELVVYLSEKHQKDWKFPQSWQIKILMVVLLLLGGYCLLKTGHYGGQLVYEQGAGIENFNSTCQY